MPEHKAYRDAVTGEYVTAEYAAEHPDTTVAETVDFASAVDDDGKEWTDGQPSDSGHGVLELLAVVLVIVALLFLVAHLSRYPG